MGHPVSGHPVSDVTDPTDITKVQAKINCLTCHQPHASAQPDLLVKDQANNMAFCSTCHKDLTKSVERSRRFSTMFEVSKKSIGSRALIAVLLLFAFMLVAPFAAYAGSKKKKDDTTAPKKTPVIDYSNIVWPNPPAIARIRYLAFYSAQKLSAG